jgi:C-terminal processing protease CtpA/Prc
VVSELAPDFVKDRNMSPMKMGIQRGDIITMVDGDAKWATSETHLIGYCLQKKKPGEKLTLTILRGGENKEFSFTLQ